MNLLVGLFLVLINSFNSSTAKIPTTEGINALVAYLFTCIFFVFCAMLGYAGTSHTSIPISRLFMTIDQVFCSPVTGELGAWVTQA